MITILSFGISTYAMSCEIEIKSPFDFRLGEWDIHMPDCKRTGNNTMHFEKGGQRLTFPVAWIPQANGDVDQELDQWNPGTESWDNDFRVSTRKRNRFNVHGH